jgi:hypothetical protein
METVARQQPKGLLSIPRLATAIFAAIYFFFYLVTKDEWHFIDNVNLIFHEAGHTIFSVFGEFLYVLGGSLFQVMFPFVFVLYFFLRKEYFSSALLLYWVGQNLINVSIYASDAVSMRLDLLGGDSVGHDWHSMLSSLHLLHYTNEISLFIYVLGVFIMFGAMCLSIYYSRMDMGES